MEKPKRYDPYYGGGKGMYEIDSGDHVKYADYEKLEKKYRIALYMMTTIIEADPRILKAFNQAIAKTTSADIPGSLIQEVLNERNSIKIKKLEKEEKEGDEEDGEAEKT